MPEKIIQTKFGKRCRHNKFVLDTSLNTVECGICGKELNPMWVLEQMSVNENRFEMHLREMKRLADKAEKKNRCKCEHCEKMTRIQRY